MEYSVSYDDSTNEYIVSVNGDCEQTFDNPHSAYVCLAALIMNDAE